MSDGKQITGHTVLTGLLGSPVAHSISPLMHNEAFRLLGLDYVYLCFDVGTDGLQTAVEGLRTMHARGFNLTMPDKKLMCRFCDRLSKASQLCGSVNTVVNDDGVLTGYTTDGIGYMDAARDAGYELRGRTITVLGAGGASASICTQAALDGVRRIHVFNRPGRSYDSMAQLAERLTAATDCKVTIADTADEEALRASIAESYMLINASSVGMAPLEDACLIRDPAVLKPTLIVSDIIYHPEQTKLLRLAEENGCRTFNGLYMLLYQGAAAFKLWTGQDMPVLQIKELYFRR